MVCVALGSDFTLAVIDAGAVFSFGSSHCWALGHGPIDRAVLLRRIEALAESGRRFVAVAAGAHHALALNEEGQVYGWGCESANGHGHHKRTPQRVTALAGERVLLVYARGDSSCAVTEKGGLFTWGDANSYDYHLGHGVAGPTQRTPTRVEALSRVKVAAAAICDSHTLVADDDGMVWGFGHDAALGLGKAGPPRVPNNAGANPGFGVDLPPGGFVVQPAPIPTLRVRTLP